MNSIHKKSYYMRSALLNLTGKSAFVFASIFIMSACDGPGSSSGANFNSISDESVESASTSPTTANPSTGKSSPTPTPVKSASPTPVKSASPTPTPSATKTVTPSPTPKPSATLSPRPSTGKNERICPGANTVAGIDVSDDQPNTDWPSVQTGGKSFAFVKATEGISFVNSDFARDWAALLETKILRGAYHYFHPNDNPVTQANLYLSKIGKLGLNDLPPMLDWEITGNDTPTAEIAAAKLWLALVQSATGKTPIIYHGPSFWNSLGNPQDFAGYPLFIANYDVSCPDIPPPYNNWTFWQQGSGPADGIKANAVDLDIFNGTEAQLTTFAQTGHM